MRYYLSVDGGGTKTAYLLTDETGNTIAKVTASGCTYSAMGAEGVFERLRNGALDTLKKAGISADELRCAVWGIPCFGEYEEMDRYLKKRIPELFPCDSYLCNDVEIGLAGSLLLKSGIHIVAGTGAIVMGRNREGAVARANGWHEAFSDEGSGHWLGMKTLALFAKQADGRESRSFLYELLYEYLGLARDMDIVSYYQLHLNGAREKVARLQKVLLLAAVRGDPGAKELYREAAWELAQSVKGVAAQLGMTGTAAEVSYCGGVFNAGSFLLTPLSSYLKKQGYSLVPPRLSPLGGGILLAAGKCGLPAGEVLENLKQTERLQISP